MKYLFTFLAIFMLISNATVEPFVETDLGTFSNHYYIAIKQSKTWNDSIIYAESLDGYLITITDKGRDWNQAYIKILFL